MMTPGSNSTWDLLTDPDDPRHGTESGYTNHLCRCIPCTEANTAAQSKNRSKRHLREPPADGHGRDSCYTNWGCRRPECVAAHSTAMRKHRADKKKEEASQ